MAARRFLASASSAATRAAAPSAESAGLARSTGLIGGHSVGRMPPVKALPGSRALFRNWPKTELQILSLQAAHCSAVGHRNENRFFGAASAATTGTPGAPGAGGTAAGATGIWARATGVNPAATIRPATV